jgi:outer membrane protein TolC
MSAARTFSAGWRFRMSAFLAAAASLAGCVQIVEHKDRDIARVIADRQRAALDYSAPAPLQDSHPDIRKPPQSAYEYAPDPRTTDPPQDFVRTASRPAVDPNDPAASAPISTAPSQPASQPTRFREKTFTLTDALAYAQHNRREYQTEKENLYLSALALTLERHLWTPIFASDIRTVYGNFGEITDFDQAMRFVADLSVAQRLPYGGNFTASAVSTLIRDVKKSITATENGVITLGLDIPFLRGAGHISDENLTQLERNLTYSVRTFERFRRRQLVEVAQVYFDLLRQKQAVLDTLSSFERAADQYQRALAMEQAGIAPALDTRRAEQLMLTQQNNVEQSREQFRAGADRFKLFIGMPVDEPIGLDDLESIEDIERQIAEGVYPALQLPEAVNDERRAIEVASDRRLDLLNTKDQIDDARRGVDIAANALLPDLNWISSLTYDTDPEHLNVAAYEVARSTWRTELLLSLPLDRFAERNRYRASLIDVKRAERLYVDELERIRAEVRLTINQVRLQQKLLDIQERNLDVADAQREEARIRFEEIGDISNRDLVDAENAWIDARDALNQAKTTGWNSLLQFRLATETLQIREDGVQEPSPADTP